MSKVLVKIPIEFVVLFGKLSPEKKSNLPILFIACVFATACTNIEQRCFENSTLAAA